MATASVMPRLLNQGVEGVGEREAAESLDRFGDRGQRHDPAREEADRDRGKPSQPETAIVPQMPRNEAADR